MFPIGTIVKINMGVSAGTLARVIHINCIKLDHHGIPRLDQGHYKPIDYKNDIPIQYLNDKRLDVLNKVFLTKVI